MVCTLAACKTVNLCNCPPTAEPVVRFQKRRKAPHSKTLARKSWGGFIIGALSRNGTNSEGFGVRRCAALLGAKVASSGLICFASRPSSGSKSGAKRRTPRRWRAGPGAGSSSGRFPGIERTPKVLECAAVRRFWAKDGRMICYSRARQTVRVTCRRSAGGWSAKRLETLVRGTERKACAAVGCRRLIRPMKFHPVPPQTRQGNWRPRPLQAKHSHSVCAIAQVASRRNR